MLMEIIKFLSIFGFPWFIFISKFICHQGNYHLDSLRIYYLLWYAKILKIIFLQYWLINLSYLSFSMFTMFTILFFYLLAVIKFLRCSFFIALFQEIPSRCIQYWSYLEPHFHIFVSLYISIYSYYI